MITSIRYLPGLVQSRRNRSAVLGSLCLQAAFLILFHIGIAHAVGSAESKDSKTTDTFFESRDRIVRWAFGFVAKKRASIAGFAKPEVPFAGKYHYASERIIFGKTSTGEECALHLGRRVESGEWAFNFYLENKKREVGSISMIHESIGSGDGAVSLEGDLVLQRQQTVPNIEAITSLDLHTTPTSMSLLSIEVYKTGTLGEKSLSVVLDEEGNVRQVTFRFVNGFRIDNGRMVDPVTCYFYYLS